MLAMSAAAALSPLLAPDLRHLASGAPPFPGITCEMRLSLIHVHPVLCVQAARIHLSPVHNKEIPNNLKGKSSSSQQWLIRQLNDPYVKKARYANYRARSAFKLIEMDDKHKFLKRGMTVVECGAAPGAWTQVLVERCGSPSATIVSVDRNPINPLPGAHILANTDFTSPAGQAKVLDLLSGRSVDLVCSDMAPNASGIAQLDHDAIAGLALSAMSFSLQVLKPGGSFLTKLWYGSRVSELHALLKKFFPIVREVKPPASRCHSAEIFLFATGFTGIRK